MAQQPPMTRQQFIASFKPQFRDKVTAMYDQYQRTHKMPSVVKQTAKAVAKDSIPWVAIPTVMAAILRRGMYGSPQQIWGSTKVIGGTALAAAALRAAYATPSTYQQKKRSVPRDYAAAAQDYILSQLQKKANGQPAPAPAAVPLDPRLDPQKQYSLNPIRDYANKVQQQQLQQTQQASQTPTPAQNTGTTAPATQAGGTWDSTKKYVQQAAGDLAQSGKNALGSVFLPGATGDRSRMYALGGIGLLLALMSGGGLGRALLFTALGAGLGYAANKWLLPNVSGWSTAANRLNSIKDVNTRKQVQSSAIDGGLNYLFGGNPRNAGSLQQSITEQIVQDQVKGTGLGTVKFNPNNTVTATPTNKNMPTVIVGDNVESEEAPTRRKPINY